MENFINIKQEIRWGDWYFRDHVADPSFDYKAHKKECSEYYRKRGFFASMMFSDFYSRVSGVESDRYMPMDVYFFYALPCLNRWDLRLAYTDKNLYETLFPDVAQPETIVKNVNGIFYDADNKEITLRSAIDIVKGCDDDGAIIKPTLDTCNGDGVSLLGTFDETAIKVRFERYNINFIVQRKVRQHSEMAKFNESSLNTLRVYTYRGLDKQIHHLNTTARFGGKGFVMDNASAGGGLCKVEESGHVSDLVVRYQRMGHCSLRRDYGVAGVKVPSYGHVLELAKGMHGRLPYFDLIGWDISVREDGEPIFIEFNVLPAVELPQLVHGPMFGEYIDEVMDRISVVKKQRTVYSVNKFRQGFNYMLPIG